MGLWVAPGLLLAMALTLHLAEASAPPHRDYCVLGAGPAGLQMAYFLQRAGRDYQVFERASRPGSFFTRYPRHRKLISINKRHTGRTNSEFNLRHDWNSLLSHDPRLLFRHYSRAYFPDAGDMVRYLGDFASRLRLRVRYNTAIAHVTLDKDRRAWNGHYFILTDQKGQGYRCSVLLVATGLSVPNLVDFPGAEYAEGYESVSVDPEDFVGQNVLILGRGNSAFETAENILGVTNFVHMLSRSRVRLSWATHYVGDLRAINNGLLDTYQLKSLDGLLESDLTDLAVVKDPKGKFHITLKFYVEEGNQSAEAVPLPQDDSDNFAMRVAYDRIIRCLGWNFDFSIFNKSLRLSSGGEFSKKYPLVRPSYESKGSRGLFVLGTASHSVDYRKSAGGFIHGFRYTGEAPPSSGTHSGFQQPSRDCSSVVDCLTFRVWDRQQWVSRRIGLEKHLIKYKSTYIWGACYMPVSCRGKCHVLVRTLSLRNVNLGSSPVGWPQRLGFITSLSSVGVLTAEVGMRGGPCPGGTVKRYRPYLGPCSCEASHTVLGTDKPE
ncbi:FAD-dependent oxidoreductase domain-containing protein 2 isoform X3 [Pipistrellus kuhlii]|uniref:FAD-dependent oxidoreductase domain-containing protein 2 isoform X3 n=1 Tax=Pipistrellus kuhlii TaxID=59472 RepID=UPI001E26F639|nr:FAD-dependent oxidoreductase domain-containing protein 2 isoform X3 [Pipistrellus kuhlii]